MAETKIDLKLITKQFDSTLTKSTKKVDGFFASVKKAIAGNKQLFDVFKGNVLANLVSKGINGIIDGFLSAGRAIKDFVLSAKDEFQEFEQALIAVRKTTDLTRQGMIEFGQDIKKLSRRMPIATTELLRFAEVAGQLGVRGKKNLLLFTETMAKLAVTTNVGGAEAAKSLARVLNVTGEGPSKIKELASALVSLGNQFELQEAELLTISERLATATAQFSVTSAEVVGFSAAMKSLGIRSQTGATSIGKLFRTLNKAIGDNGTQLQKFAKLMKITTDELSTSFSENATKTILQFLEALGKVPGGGKQVSKTMDDLGLKGDRLAATIPVLALRFEKLRSTLAAANLEFSNGAKAIDEEALKAFDSMKSDSIKLSTSIDNLKTSFIEAFAPEIRSAINLFTKAFEDLDDAITKNFGEGVNVEILKLQDLIDKTKDSLIQVVRTMGALKDASTTAEKSILFRATQDSIFLEKRLDNLILKISILKQGERDVPDAPPGGGGGVGGEGGTLQAELDLRKVFAESLKAFELQLAEEKTLARQVEFEDGFAILEQNLGTEETLRLLFQIKELEAAGKHDEAKKKLQDAFFKARQKSLKTEADEEKAFAEASKKLELATGRARANVASATANLISAASADGSKAAFIAQKTAAIGQAIVSKELAATTARATPPVPNFSLEGLARTAGNISIATIIATTIKGFAGGGIVGGNSVAGDNILAGVNSKEMILNTSQQTELFNIAKGQVPGSSQTQEIFVTTTVMLDGEKIGESVSRQVANGLELGEVQ